MKRVVTGWQMQEFDRHTIEDIGIPSAVLMERAALEALKVLYEEKFDLTKVLVIAGSGNNGGDGIAMARLLFLKGVDVEIYIPKQFTRFSEGHLLERQIAENYGIPFVSKGDLSNYTTLVDSLFGVGLSRELSGDMASLVEEMNDSQCRIFSLDIPSGLDSEQGQIRGVSVQADVTATFAFAKTGQLIYPGRGLCGKLHICDIGIYQPKSNTHLPLFYSYDDSDIGDLLPPRDQGGNKGSFGKLLLVAGSYGMSGAACLAARAALYMGAGMVKIMTVEENREILQGQLPEALLSLYGREKGPTIEQLEADLSWSDAVVVGPGLGQSHAAKELLKNLLTLCQLPLLVDADGLNLLAEDPDCMEAFCQLRADKVITPHMGEMCRLTGLSIGDILQDRFSISQNFAKGCRCVCHLKDAASVTAGGNEQFMINTSGNSGMATAGSGDVLSGMAGGLLAQGMKAKEAIGLAAYLHGRAGDLAAQKLSEYSLTAGKITGAIPEIIRKVYNYK